MSSKEDLVGGHDVARGAASKACTRLVSQYTDGRSTLDRFLDVGDGGARMEVSFFAPQSDQ